MVVVESEAAGGAERGEGVGDATQAVAVWGDVELVCRFFEEGGGVFIKEDHFYGMRAVV